MDADGHEISWTAPGYAEPRADQLVAVATQ